MKTEEKHSSLKCRRPWMMVVMKNQVNLWTMLILGAGAQRCMKRKLSEKRMIKHITPVWSVIINLLQTKKLRMMLLSREVVLQDVMLLRKDLQNNRMTLVN